MCGSNPLIAQACIHVLLNLKTNVMLKVRTGCIEVTLDNSGRVIQNKCTFPIPKEVADSINYVDCQFIKNKWFFVKYDIDIDNLWYQINLMQVIVNDYKISLYEVKKEIALINCASFYNSND